VGFLSPGDQFLRVEGYVRAALLLGSFLIALLLPIYRAAERVGAYSTRGP
jgi:hypothetical protein